MYKVDVFIIESSYIILSSAPDFRENFITLSNRVMIHNSNIFNMRERLILVIGFRF